MNNLPSTGLHYGVPFDQYRAWDAANISTLKNMKRSAAHCRWEMDHPRESDEMNVGSATHIALLEPARFEKEFCIAPEFDARTKEGKAIKEKAEAEAAGRTLLRAGDAGDVKGMADAVWKCKAARRLLEMPGQCEVSALWKDEITGLLCKGRFDKLINSSRPIILEVKTTRNADEFAFSKDCYGMGYAAQAAYYLAGHRAVTTVTPLHVILAIENKGPWCCRLWTLDDAALMVGATEWRHYLDDYASCVKSGQWPGYPDEVQTLSLPRWATFETSE